MTRARLVLDVDFDDPEAMRGYLRDLADHLEEYGLYTARLVHQGREVGYLQIDAEDLP